MSKKNPNTRDAEESRKVPPPEGHIAATPHGRSILERGQILKPIEVEDCWQILDGYDRQDVAHRHMSIRPPASSGPHQS